MKRYLGQPQGKILATPLHCSRSWAKVSLEQRSSYEALPVVVRGKCPEEMPETNSNAMGVVNSKLAQCPLLEKEDKNPRTVGHISGHILYQNR